MASEVHVHRYNASLRDHIGRYGAIEECAIVVATIGITLSDAPSVKCNILDFLARSTQVTPEDLNVDRVHDSWLHCDGSRVVPFWCGSR